jgi:AhpC/TSA antioxidant enzyme
VSPPTSTDSYLRVTITNTSTQVAEKTFRQLAHLSNKHPEISFIAVSHSDQAATDKWIVSIGGEWSADVIVDTERQLYAGWGLGLSSAWHVLNPWSIYSVYKLAKDEKIWNKGTESGTRWQTAGSFAVDANGVVKWVKVAKSADDMPDLKEALKAVEVGK